jgi:cytochrome c-type biogenesis protein CcmH
MNYSRGDGLTQPTRTIWLSFAAVLAVLAGVGYLLLGDNFGRSISVTPKAGDAPSASAPVAPTKSLKALSDEQLERMVVQATTLTQQDAKNASAWAMLAHSYEMMGKFSESAKAYAKLAPLLPRDAQVLADYADVLAVANGRTFKGEPFALLKQALALDPKNVKALVLAGSAYMEEQDTAQAISHLERARSASTDAALQGQIDASIAQAKALSGATPSVAIAAPATTPVASE